MPESVLTESSLLYADADLVIVDKPAGLLTIDAPGHPSDETVISALRRLLARREQSRRVFAVHRLDRETTGAIAFARNERARNALDAIFEAHTAERVYHAIVIGLPNPRTGTLESRLAEDANGNVQCVRKGGKRAVMHYVTVAELDGFAVVACKLETGRRNQIRVQMADCGYPVAGDRKYGRRHGGFGRVAAKRSLLHATALAFSHPFTRQQVRGIAPFPADFRDLLGDTLLEKLSL